MKITRTIRSDRGAVLAMVAVSLAVLLGVGGLALDSARGYLTKARLARAADAAVLAGARSLRLGEDVARERATQIAILNGARMGTAGTDLDITFGVNAEGESTIRVDTHVDMPTRLMTVLGIDSMDVRASAVAAVPPVDLVLVLDQSGSLKSADAFDDLQDAAKLFIDYFDDGIDQVGLVSFNVRGTERSPLAHSFTSRIKNEIDQLTSFGHTNAGEGLRLANGQITGPSARQRSTKVVVFFTDGRPTAFRGDIDTEDRILTVGTTGTSIYGYYDDPDNIPTTYLPPSDGCTGVPDCFGWNEPQTRAQARQLGLDYASELREAGIIVYSIALGNPNLSHPLLQPDLDYLREIANEGGIADSSQPRGKSYFAPSAFELRGVFQQVASDLMTRLAQ